MENTSDSEDSFVVVSDKSSTSSRKSSISSTGFEKLSVNDTDEDVTCSDVELDEEDITIPEKTVSAPIQPSPLPQTSTTISEHEDDPLEALDNITDLAVSMLREQGIGTVGQLANLDQIFCEALDIPFLDHYRTLAQNMISGINHSRGNNNNNIDVFPLTQSNLRKLEETHQTEQGNLFGTTTPFSDMNTEIPSYGKHKEALPKRMIGFLESEPTTTTTTTSYAALKTLEEETDSSIKGLEQMYSAEKELRMHKQFLEEAKEWKQPQTPFSYPETRREEINKAQQKINEQDAAMQRQLEKERAQAMLAMARNSVPLVANQEASFLAQSAYSPASATSGPPTLFTLAKDEKIDFCTVSEVDLERIAVRYADLAYLFRGMIKESFLRGKMSINVNEVLVEDILQIDDYDVQTLARLNIRSAYQLHQLQNTGLLENIASVSPTIRAAVTRAETIVRLSYDHSLIRPNMKNFNFLQAHLARMYETLRKWAPVIASQKEAPSDIAETQFLRELAATEPVRLPTVVQPTPELTAEWVPEVFPGTTQSPDDSVMTLEGCTEDARALLATHYILTVRHLAQFNDITDFCKVNISPQVSYGYLKRLQHKASVFMANYEEKTKQLLQSPKADVWGYHYLSEEVLLQIKEDGILKSAYVLFLDYFYCSPEQRSLHPWKRIYYAYLNDTQKWVHNRNKDAITDIDVYSFLVWRSTSSFGALDATSGPKAIYFTWTPMPPRIRADCIEIDRILAEDNRNNLIADRYYRVIRINLSKLVREHGGKLHRAIKKDNRVDTNNWLPTTMDEADTCSWESSKTAWADFEPGETYFEKVPHGCIVLPSGKIPLDCLDLELAAPAPSEDARAEQAAKLASYKKIQEFDQEIVAYREENRNAPEADVIPAYWSELHKKEQKDYTIMEQRDLLDVFEPIPSQIFDFLFLGSRVLASKKDVLKNNNITHILNCAGGACLNYFPGEYTYKTYHISDGSKEDISCLFYETLDFIEEARSSGGRILIHGYQGVSRSVACVILYIMWRNNWSYQEAHKFVQDIRFVANPNTGFVVQLIEWYDRLHQPSPQQLRLYRMIDHSQYTLVVPKLVPVRHASALDPRSCFVLHTPTRMYLWIGSSCQTYMVEGAERSIARLQKYERAPMEVTVETQGKESEEFWGAIGGYTGSPVTPLSEYDRDYGKSSLATPHSNEPASKAEEKAKKAEEQRSGSLKSWRELESLDSDEEAEEMDDAIFHFNAEEVDKEVDDLIFSEEEEEDDSIWE